MTTTHRPEIPVGLATKAGATAGLVGLIAALVAAILDGDHTAETLGALGFAALNLYGLIRGRSDQAAALYASQSAARAGAGDEALLDAEAGAGPDGPAAP